MTHENRYEQIGVAMTCRSFDEYENMFVLDDALLRRGPVLDVAAGASSFTAQAVRQGYTACAADSLYHFTPEQIAEHGFSEIETSTEKLSKLKHLFCWDYYGSLERHRDNRLRSLKLFIDDYSLDDASSRYVKASLPALPFASDTFSLVLCSHFLFLYEEQFDYDFHVRALKELVRVCRKGGEIRIYPLAGFKWNVYPHLERLLEEMREYGATAETIRSRLPFMPGSTHLLRLAKTFDSFDRSPSGQQQPKESAGAQRLTKNGRLDVGSPPEKRS